MTAPFQIAVVSCGPSGPARLITLTPAGFRGHETLGPPSGAVSETVETVHRFFSPVDPTHHFSHRSLSSGDEIVIGTWL